MIVLRHHAFTTINTKRNLRAIADELEDTALIGRLSGSSIRNLGLGPFFYSYYHFDHGTIIRTGITCEKIPCYMRDSACRWFIVKKAKIF